MGQNAARETDAGRIVWSAGQGNEKTGDNAQAFRRVPRKIVRVPTCRFQICRRKDRKGSHAANEDANRTNADRKNGRRCQKTAFLIAFSCCSSDLRIS